MLCHYRHSVGKQFILISSVYKAVLYVQYYVTGCVSEVLSGMKMK